MDLIGLMIFYIVFSYFFISCNFLWAADIFEDDDVTVQFSSGKKVVVPLTLQIAQYVKKQSLPKPPAPPQRASTEPSRPSAFQPYNQIKRKKILQASQSDNDIKSNLFKPIKEEDEYSSLEKENDLLRTEVEFYKNDLIQYKAKCNQLEEAIKTLTLSIPVDKAQLTLNTERKDD